MSWLLSILAAVLSAGLGLGGGGWIANKCVSWYSISSREGQSGYFVIFFALAGGVAGLVLGLILSRVVVAMDGAAWASVLVPIACMPVLLAAALWISWARADIEPTIGGKPLCLEIEFRSPPASIAPAPSEADRFTLHSVSSWKRVARRSVPGEIRWSSLKRNEDRWLLTCGVDLFTYRGERVVSVNVGGIDEGFGVPVPSSPGAEYMQWSQWLPRERPDGKPPVNKLTYRFRVRPRDEVQAGGG